MAISHSLSERVAQGSQFPHCRPVRLEQHGHADLLSMRLRRNWHVLGIRSVSRFSVEMDCGSYDCRQKPQKNENRGQQPLSPQWFVLIGMKKQPAAYCYCGYSDQKQHVSSAKHKASPLTAFCMT